MKPIKIMINGIPGHVAIHMASFVLKDPKFQLVPFSLTGPEITAGTHDLGQTRIDLLKPLERKSAITGIKKEWDPFISVDYTHPSAVNSNAEFYIDHGLPFVMGTTGGDRKLLETTVRGSSISAVIAPNMAKQIVGLQAMMEYAATTFPGLFSGYSLQVKESHQQGKADTSGTAKAMVSCFNDLGVPFSTDDIIKERNPENQVAKWGIPEEFLQGHGWHTYTLESKDKTSKFVITHNINGRDIYVEGTMDAVIYLNKKITNGSRGQVFSMVDVLRS